MLIFLEQAITWIQGRHSFLLEVGLRIYIIQYICLVYMVAIHPFIRFFDIMLVAMLYINRISQTTIYLGVRGFINRSALSNRACSR
jgi:hypothetical protein